LVGDIWARIRFNLNVFRRNLRRLGFAVQDAFHVEANPLGTGHHAHLWTWGPSLLDEAAVSEAAVRAGMGREVWVGHRERPAGAPLWYGMKTVLDFAHPTQLAPEISQYLELNGGRLLHASRGFWRDAEGREIRGGVRAAAKLARRQGSDDEWAIVNLPPGLVQTCDLDTRSTRRAASQPSSAWSGMRLERAFL
jgi:hypothetical protein